MDQAENAVPLVSIGMPVYNGEDFIKEALDSILAQTFQDFELIISDNASTDKTEVICREYAARDNRIRYYRNNKNLGAAPNYNILVSYARGKYFKWAAHDDVLAPEFIEKCVKSLEKNSFAILAYTKAAIINETGQVQEKFSSGLNLEKNTHFQRLKTFHKYSITYNDTKDEPIFGVIRISEIKKTHLIGNYIGSDLSMLAELVLLGRFCEIPEYLFFRRRHRKSSVTKNLNFDERLSWFDSKKSGTFIFVHWRHLFGYISAISRIAMPLDQKVLCYFQMLIYLFKKRYFYIDELGYNIRRFLGDKAIQRW